MAVLVDSNVLLYLVDVEEPDRGAAAAAWLDVLWPRALGRLSTQVLNEFYWNATRRLRTPLSYDEARRVVRRYHGWLTAPIDATTLDAAFRIESRFELAWWDALIVAAAQRANCRWLLTEDLQDGQSFDGVVVVDPFRHTPDEILGDDGAGQVSETVPRRRRGGRPSRNREAPRAV